jgi:hypothetical protein
MKFEEVNESDNWKMGKKRKVLPKGSKMTNLQYLGKINCSKISIVQK